MKSNRGKLLTYLIIAVAAIGFLYVMISRTTTKSINGLGGAGGIETDDPTSPGGISFMLRSWIDTLLSPFLGSFGTQKGPDAGLPPGSDDWRDQSPEENGGSTNGNDRQPGDPPTTPNTPTNTGTSSPPVNSKNTGTTTKDRVVTIRTQLPIAKRTFDPLGGALAGVFGKSTAKPIITKHTKSGKKRYGGGPGA
jgi:hypothetical protein